jgi:hypothetical protein
MSYNESPDNYFKRDSMATSARTGRCSPERPVGGRSDLANKTSMPLLTRPATQNARLTRRADAPARSDSPALGAGRMSKLRTQPGAGA